MHQASFGHERLVVYQKALAFVADAEDFLNVWEKKYAIVDHLSRACESIIVNMAEGCRADALKAKQVAIDYALGSTLECAACVDIARIRGLLSPDDALRQKGRLSAVASMLVGLRKSWEFQGVQEEQSAYETTPSGDADQLLFHHEELDAYRVALDFLKWLCSDGRESQLPARAFRHFDQAATSMILNIAEGNGRFSQLDRRRFLAIANTAAVKLGAYLDLCARRRIFTLEETVAAKGLLVRVANMTAAMADSG